jgi:hypothetical protein
MHGRAIHTRQADANGAQIYGLQPRLALGLPRGSKNFALGGAKSDLEGIRRARNGTTQDLFSLVGQPGCGVSPASVDAQKVWHRAMR